MPEIKFTKLFINGQFIDAVSGKTFDSVDPRTEDVIAKVAEGDKEDVDRAVKAARVAFDKGPWPRMSGSERGALMLKFAELIDQHVDELGTLEALDAGKLLVVTKAHDIRFASKTLRYYAGAADKIHGETLKMSRALLGHTWREPVGVVGLIIPWNFPTVLLFANLAPALAAGCAVVVKPAEQTPLTALYYAHLSKMAGIPQGVINVVTGFGPTAGAAITSHMNVDKGEICVAGSRILVQEGIYDEFFKRLEKRTNEWVVGDPFDPRVKQGPQVDKKQYDKILGYIEQGRREGATLLTGGEPCGGRGFYIRPTVFVDVKEDMTIAKEEIFGPVMAVMKFKTIEEAIAKANNSKYGLAAGIVTNDLNISNTVSRSIRAGAVWINCYFAFDADCPYGGFKMSGFGRTLGLHALDKFLQVKSVVTPLHGSPWL